MRLSGTSKLIALAAAVGSSSAVVQADRSDERNLQSAPDFTCVVLQFEENGCTADDFALVGDMMSTLFYTELDLTEMVFVDAVATTEEVITVTPNGNGTRKLLANICYVAGYCQSNPKVCRIYGCPGWNRRNLRQLQTTTHDMGELSFKGAMLLNGLETSNADCNFKEMGFQCDYV
jgi:hypothetical protein